jgi:hypothetical protein
MNEAYKTKQDKNLNLNNENLDPVTGRPYFHPATGRSPIG